MKNFELVSFSTADQLAQAAAGAWLDEVESANRDGTPQFVALSGGRIARQFFASVVELARPRAVSLSDVHFFWADERCVPPSDAESNFALANRLLLKPLGIAPNKIHRIRGELPPEQAAAAAAQEIIRVVPADKSGQPVLDLVFLGMGEDGHVASLFPGELEELGRNKALYRAVFAPKPPPWRVTMGGGPIVVARQVWVLVSDPGKAAVLRESLSPEGQTPLAEVIRMRPQTRILTDIRFASC